MDARFDDLLARPPRSFRLAEPVGLIEARRLDEVAGALAAAEAAADRGFWAAGFCAYEAAPGLDPALAVLQRTDADPFAHLPLAWFAVFEHAVDVPALEPPRGEGGQATGPDAWMPSVARSRFEASVDAIRRRIAAGDVYQVNYTHRLRATIAGDERGLYRDACLAQRGAYAAYLNLGRYRIVSASPELFFAIDGDRITTRPMKGTAPRGRWPAEDAARAETLASSPKDRAENAMIVDLLRNDLGRIARPGSVRVAEMYRPERYETVWQLTSTIAATLRADVGLVDVFRALFPSGSVTGAPKIASMRIIAELEDSPRGAYTGAIGYLAPGGSPGPRARFSVGIRTILHDADSGLAEYGVGGGITHDSSAAGEYEETLAKARILAVRRPEFSLLEALRYEPALGLRHLERHLDRLRASAGYFSFAWDEVVVREALVEAVAGVDEVVRVRCELARDGAVGIRLEPTPGERSSDPVRIAIDDVAVDPDDPLLYHKTTLRGRYERAAARHPHADDVVLVNTRGEVTESTIANIAVRRSGRWSTPPLDAGLLPGIGRAIALEEGTLEERSLTVDDLRRAEAVALVSSVRGWRRAVPRIASGVPRARR
jgi:para-aminobenzoate synthetase / 4-amino-4-deoxychorismate lyase